MPNISPPLRRDDLDDSALNEAEAQMRQALQRLSTGSAQQQQGPGAEPAAPPLPCRRVAAPHWTAVF